MFPLSVVMVGCRVDTQLNSVIWQELRNVPAVVEAEFTGVATMIAQLPHSFGKHRLFILPVFGPHDIEELKLIEENFPGSPILAVVDINDSQMILQTNRAGASQIVPIPISPEEFLEAMEAISRRFGHELKYATVVAVSGVTGGCGATTLAVNLGYEVSLLPKSKCILSELAQVGVLSTYLRVKSNYTTEDLFSGQAGHGDLRVVETSLTEVTPTFFFLPGPDRAAAGQGPRTVDELDQYVNYLRRLSTLVVIDLPCSFDEGYFERLAICDEVLLVAEQSVRSIRAMKLLKDSINRGGYRDVHEVKFRHVINRYKSNLQGFEVDRLKELLQLPELFTVGNDYSSMSDAMNRGKPLRMVNPKSPIMHELETLARSVTPTLELGDGEVKKKKDSSLMGNFRSLVRAFGFK